MSLDAASAAERMMAATEGGGAAACVLSVAGDDAGCRFLLVRVAGGAEEVSGSLGRSDLDAAARTLATTALADPGARDGLRDLHPETGPDVEVYLEVRRPVRDLVIVGAGHIARPLCTLGALLGFRVTVVDDRPDFATRERFPEAERVLRADFSDPFRDVRLHPGSHVLLVTRGHKYDYECLLRALRVDPAPAYIGMIGSRRRVRATFVQLREEGFDAEALDRVHAPVGLDLGAETPEEIAVAVAAELVLVSRGGTGAPLKGVARVARRFLHDDAKGAGP